MVTLDQGQSREMNVESAVKIHAIRSSRVEMSAGFSKKIFFAELHYKSNSPTSHLSIFSFRGLYLVETLQLHDLRDSSLILYIFMANDDNEHAYSRQAMHHHSNLKVSTMNLKLKRLNLVK